MQMRVGSNRAVIAALTATAAMAAGVGPASAVGSDSRAAKVLTTDGPGQLTMRTAGKRVKVVLAGIDGPRAGECGAAEATEALRTLTRKYRKGVSLTTYTDRGKQLRAPDGRVLASVSYRSGRGWGSTFGDSLIEQGWARTGVRYPSSKAEQLAGDRDGPADDETVGAANQSRGVWVRCGGRMHLPAGETPPAYQPSIWSIDVNGITRSIGGVPLNPSMAPESTWLLPQAASAFGAIEWTISDESCEAWAPERHVAIVASNEIWGTGSPDPMDCRQAAVFAILSAGPQVVSSDRGLQTGALLQSAQPLFPGLTDKRLKETSSENFVELSTSPWRPWAWKSYLITEDSTKRTTGDDRITGFLTLVFSVT